MLSREFLESKVNALLDYWKENEVFGWGGERCIGPGFIYTPTQAYETETGLRFILWNLIREFDGHYECVVNVDTFEYSIKQHSYYGSLTYTTPPKDHKVYRAEDLSDIQKLTIEASIALTVMECLGLSYYKIDVVSARIQEFVWHRVTSDNLLLP